MAVALPLLLSGARSLARIAMTFPTSKRLPAKTRLARFSRASQVTAFPLPMIAALRVVLSVFAKLGVWMLSTISELNLGQILSSGSTIVEPQSFLRIRCSRCLKFFWVISEFTAELYLRDPHLSLELSMLAPYNRLFHPLLCLDVVTSNYLPRGNNTIHVPSFE